ncbi:DUF6226 family protein [Actinoplanes sp. GCM10030250]|uniref:DUF6226 family protein n=1 Tax=Actinoplanes sp. GCM10030250 TaxID=3273376 RepID=UPI00366C9AFD
MEERYAALGMPSWPNPHAGRDASDEEYSRVTDPARYRILHARARVWTSVLAELPGVRVEGERITSERPGTLPLFLAASLVPLTGQDGELPVLQISAGRPDVVVDRQPDCGCDACDWGSEDLLETVDERIRMIVGGPFVALKGDGWQAQWWPEGGSVSTREDFEATMDLCRRVSAGEDVELPPGTEVFAGRSWS